MLAGYDNGLVSNVKSCKVKTFVSVFFTHKLIVWTKSIGKNMLFTVLLDDGICSSDINKTSS